MRPLLHGREPGGLRPRADWEDITQLLDNAITIKPRRQLSVQFSGGEPTLSPYFLDAIRYARKVGYKVVQAATNGIEFAKSPEFARAAAAAGLRYAYLQFDGIGNAANAHRRVGNLFDVKLQAIEHSSTPASASCRSSRSSTASTTSRSAAWSSSRSTTRGRSRFLSFQPVSFSGRDEAITDERRQAQRYTLSHLAHDVKTSDRARRAGARLVSDLVHVDVHRLGRSRARARGAVGSDHVRLPSQLRRRHGGDDRQGRRRRPCR